jgi:hypothetical protein
VSELDPGMSCKRTAVVTDAYSDGMACDAVRVQHSTKCYRSCQTQWAKDAVS